MSLKLFSYKIEQRTFSKRGEQLCHQRHARHAIPSTADLMLEPSPNSSCFKKSTFSYPVTFFTQPPLLPFSFLYVSFQDMRLLSMGQPLCTKSFWEIHFCQAVKKYKSTLVRSPSIPTKLTLKLLGHGLPSLYNSHFVTWSRLGELRKFSSCTELKETFTLLNNR